MNYADYQNNNLKLRQISTSNTESHKVILIVSPNCKIVDIVEQVIQYGAISDDESRLYFYDNAYGSIRLIQRNK